ncbi:MAG: zinc-ribbon domain-containing protein, partial [Oscillospiraceae bacterium]
MFCQKCGAQLPENAKFCANCGAANEFAAQNNTVPQPVQNVEPVQPAQPQNPTELLMNEYYKAAEPQTAAQQPSYSQEGPQPVRYTAEPVPLTPAPKKKRSKLIPGLCIAAGAVVVLGGAGAIVYNLNKANITRMIMGDANYAYSVAMQAASNLTVPDESMNAVVRSAMKAGVSPSAAENVIESAADAANGDLFYDEIVDGVVDV